MVYFPDQSLSDGGAETESQGFFDVYNTSPWDIWVAFVSELGNKDISHSEYLIAWVPPAFVELAGAGIRANPDECILWLDESEVSLARLIEEGMTGSGPIHATN